MTLIGRSSNITQMYFFFYIISLIKSFFFHRYSIALLERFFVPETRDSGTDVNVAQTVALTRDVCKMKYIVGCAPVVYGIPVSISKTS